MTPRTRVWLATALALLLPAAARAQPERPKEEDLFGGQQKPAAAPPAEPARPQPPAPAGDERDQANLGTRDAPVQLSADAAPDNPLTIGGQFYVRTVVNALHKQKAQDWSFSSPALLDAYFDARPNNRVRGFVLGRMSFDPTLPAQAAAITTTAGGGSLQPSGDVMGAGTLNTLTTGRTRGPQVVLDQMWLRFDLGHTLFVTAGKQHVRWGTARLWTPADFLHLKRRNPLDVFDARTGTTMIKLHLPWESQGWNFYAYGLTEGNEATPTVSDIAGAGRMEIVLGTCELGLGGLIQRDRKPKVAADLSAGIWDFDVYGEAALRYASEIDRVGFNPAVTLDLGKLATLDQRGVLDLLDKRYPVYNEIGVRPQVVGGISWAHQYADKDVLTIGVEYFYNALGYSDAAVYPGLILPRQLAEPASFFYLGRQYAGLFVTLPAPYSWDLHSFSFSTLANLSDRSYISRFDYGLTLLTHLHFEAYVAVHYGRSNGEFRFAIPELGRAAAMLDLGLGLRVSL
jgi:hypothetical protein